MREINKPALEKAGKTRFESDYNYAVYEYQRSPKIIKELDNEGIDYRNSIILDDGCGSGGITVSLGEECKMAVGIDIAPKFEKTAVRLAKELKLKGAHFLQSDGCALPFSDDSFDLIISHSVIEHTDYPLKYLEEAFRILKNGGILFLETPPYYSFEGTHLPKPAVPIPFQLFLPRRVLYSLYLHISKKHPGFFRDGINGSALLTSIKKGKTPEMEPLNKMKIGKLLKYSKKAGFKVMKEKRYYPKGFNKIMPRFIISLMIKLPLTRNFVVNTYKLFLVKNEKVI